MGRVPKATMSLMYWNVRFESICGNGPGSGGNIAAGAGSGAAALPAAAALAAGVDDDPLLQAVLASRNISKGRRRLNHGEHGGTRGEPVRLGVLGIFSDLMLPP